MRGARTGRKTPLVVLKVNQTVLLLSERKFMYRIKEVSDEWNE